MLIFSEKPLLLLLLQKIKKGRFLKNLPYQMLKIFVGLFCSFPFPF